MIELTQTQKEWLINNLNWDDTMPQEANDFRKKGVIVPKDNGSVHHTADKDFPYSVGTIKDGVYLEIECLSEKLYLQLLKH